MITALIIYIVISEIIHIRTSSRHIKRMREIRQTISDMKPTIAAHVHRSHVLSEVVKDVDRARDLLDPARTPLESRVRTILDSAIRKAQ